MSESYPSWHQNRSRNQSQRYGFDAKFNAPTSKVGNVSVSQFGNNKGPNPASFANPPNRLNVHQRLNCVTIPDDEPADFGGNWQTNLPANVHPQQVGNELNRGAVGRNIAYANNPASFPNAACNVNSYMYNSSLQPCMVANQSQSFPAAQFQQDSNLNRQPFNSWERHPQQDLHNSQGNGYNQWNVNQQGNAHSPAVDWNSRQLQNRNSENFPVGNILQDGCNNGSRKFRQQSSSPPQRKKLRKDGPFVERSKSPQEKEVVEGFMTMPPSGTSASSVVRTINARLHEQFGYTGPVVRYGHFSSNYHVLHFPTQQVLQLVVHNMSPLKVEGSKLFVHLTMSKPPSGSDGKQVLKSNKKPGTETLDDIIELEPMEDNDCDVRTRPSSTSNYNKGKTKAKSGSGAKGKINPRPRGVFPDAIQPLTLVLVVDEAVPYLSTHQLRLKGYKILSGRNLDAIGFLELIRNDESFKEDGVLYVIIPYLDFCLKHINLFAIKEITSPVASDALGSSIKDSKSDIDSSMKQSSEPTSLLTIVKDFSSEISPVDLDVLSSCGGGLSGSDAERDRSMDEPLYAERLLTARLLHSAMRLRSGVRDAALNSDLVFCGFPQHAMRTAGAERCFKNKGSVKQISQITSALMTALRAFNEFAANTWKLGYISKIPSFNLSPEEFWEEDAFERREEEEDDDASDVEILAETSTSGGRGGRATRGRVGRVSRDVITLGDDDATSCGGDEGGSDKQDESAAPDHVSEDKAESNGQDESGALVNVSEDKANSNGQDESGALVNVSEDKAKSNGQDESGALGNVSEDQAKSNGQDESGGEAVTAPGDVIGDDGNSNGDESVGNAGAVPDDAKMDCDACHEHPETETPSQEANKSTHEAANPAQEGANPAQGAASPAHKSPTDKKDTTTLSLSPEKSTTSEPKNNAELEHVDSNESKKSCDLEDVSENVADSEEKMEVSDDAVVEKIADSEDKVEVPEDAEDELELEHDVLFIDNTENFDDLPLDDNDPTVDDNLNETVKDIVEQNSSKTDCKSTTAKSNTNIPSSCGTIYNDPKERSRGTSGDPHSTRSHGYTSEQQQQEEEVEEESDPEDEGAEPCPDGVLPLVRLGKHRWFGAAVSGGGGGRCFNRSLERATQWYMGVLFRLLDLSSKLMDKRGSFLPWLPPSVTPTSQLGEVSGAVATSVEAAVYLECQSLADDEDSSVPVSYSCILCDVDLPDVEAADAHAYTLDHCSLLKKRCNDLPPVTLSQLLGRVPLKGSRGLSQEYLDRLERAHLLQRVPSARWRCLACDGHTLYDAGRLRHHLHDLHHRALVNVRLGLTKARQRVLQHEHWALVKTRLRRHPDLSVVLISDDMNYSVLQPLTRLHDRIQVWTFNNLLREPSGRAAALARWRELSGVAPAVLWLLVTGIDLLVTTTDAEETPNVDQILDHVYSLHSFLRVNLPASHIVLTTPVLPLNILVDTLPRALTSSLMNASNSIIVAEDEVRRIRRPYELLFSRSLALHAANAAHENVHRLAKSAVSSCVVRVLEPRDIEPQASALPHYFMSTPWHIAVEGLALAAVYGLPAPYLRRCHDATAAGLNLHELEEEPRLSRAVVVGDVKWTAQSALAKRRLTGRKRRLEFSAADLAYVLEYAEPAPHNPVTWCLTAPVPGAIMRSMPNPACVTNRCKKGLRTWLYQSPHVDGDAAACNMRTFLTKLQSKLPRGNFANVFPIFPTNIITYKIPDRATHDAIHEFYEQFPNTYFTQEPLNRVRDSMNELRGIWGKLFLSNKLGHTLQVDDALACINVFPITKEVTDVRKMVIQQAEDWLTTVNAYFTDFSPLITVSLAEDAIREPPSDGDPEKDSTPEPIELE